MLLDEEPICDQIENDTGVFPEPSIGPDDYCRERYEFFLKSTGPGS
jgi:hypothetical protein